MASRLEQPALAEFDQAPSQPRLGSLTWKKPTAWWIMFLAPFNVIVESAIFSAQVGLYGDLVCRFRQEVLAPEAPCASDPEVQIIVTKLISVIVTTTGVLSLLTTGWWGSFTDRRGRRVMLGIGASGYLALCVNTLLVINFSNWLPGGYWFLVMNGILHGIVGGSAAENTAMLAYLSDVSNLSTRSRIFSAAFGCLVIGIGIGPMLASLLIRYTQSVSVVFYVATGIKLVYTLTVWFILPESSTPGQREEAKAKYEAFQTTNAGIHWAKRLLVPIEPLLIILPRKQPGTNKRSWDLFLLVLADGLALMVIASIIFQFLYTVVAFGWTAEYIGYCYSTLNFAKAIYLLSVLPLGIRYLNSRSERAHVSSETQSLLAARPAPSSIVVDFKIVRLSVLADLATFLLLPLAPNGKVFIAAIAFGALGSAIAPVVRSVALELYTKSLGEGEPVESGKLLGALSILQALFGSIIGPAFYGAVYAATVATFPRAIFLVGIANCVLSLTLLSFVKLGSKPVHSRAYIDRH